VRVRVRVRGEGEDLLAVHPAAQRLIDAQDGGGELVHLGGGRGGGRGGVRGGLRVGVKG